MTKRYLIPICCSFFILLFFVTSEVYAHVKWFSEFRFTDQPLALSQVLTPLFWGLTGFSVLVIGSLVFLDLRLQNTYWYRRLLGWLNSYKPHSFTVMRVTTGAVLLLSWQVDTMLIPELKIPWVWVGWLQFLLACLLLFKRTVPFAGLGIIGLYFLSLGQVGPLHLLDYLIFLGAGYYLLVSRITYPRLRGSGLPVLYFTVGFSLCWAALEKLIYPQWGLYVLEQIPQLALGFELSFFLLGSAFVEFSLGYLLMICLLERPMALTITLVFFTTTLIFGKMEVIGHTLIHGALLVFLIEGPGTIYRAPISFHQKTRLRIMFASVNFLIVLGILLGLYSLVAHSIWQSQ